MTNGKDNLGTVYLVGAGPGDPSLITVKGKRLLAECDVVIYDNLAPFELLLDLPVETELFYVGKQAGDHALTQDDINQLMVDRAGAGKIVVRLKGGDPFVFGRGGEEAAFLRENGIPYEIVPGVTAGVAGPAYAGIPVTERNLSSQVTFFTGHKSAVKDEGSVDWKWVAGSNGTLVIYMGVGELENIVSKLLQGGMKPTTPAAMIERGTYPTQRVVEATLKQLPEQAKNNNVAPPALVVVGEVVSLGKELAWTDSGPLAGSRVLVTRPADQAAHLYGQLRQLGTEVLAYPTIRTEPQFDSDGSRKLKSEFKGEQWLVFTSENGVRYFVKQFMQGAGDLRRLAQFKIASVGVGTSAGLERFMLKPDFMPEVSSTAELAREIVTRLNPEGKRFIRIRGNLADASVEETIAQAGGEVIPFHVYKTSFREWTKPAVRKLLDYPPNYVLFTSGSTVEGFVKNLSKDDLDKLARQFAVISIGPMTSKTVKSYGLKVAAEATSHNLPGVVKALLKHKSNH